MSRLIIPAPEFQQIVVDSRKVDNFWCDACDASILTSQSNPWGKAEVQLSNRNQVSCSLRKCCRNVLSFCVACCPKCPVWNYITLSRLWILVSKCLRLVHSHIRMFFRSDCATCFWFMRRETSCGLNIIASKPSTCVASDDRPKHHEACSNVFGTL